MRMRSELVGFTHLITTTHTHKQTHYIHIQITYIYMIMNIYGCSSRRHNTLGGRRRLDWPADSPRPILFTLVQIHRLDSVGRQFANMPLNSTKLPSFFHFFFFRRLCVSTDTPHSLHARRARRPPNERGPVVRVTGNVRHGPSECYPKKNLVNGSFTHRYRIRRCGSVIVICGAE